MALAKYGQTRLIFLPYDIQCIIFNEYTELVTREAFEDMIDDIPSQLSCDLPPDTMFVYDPRPQYPSLYEKLMQELYTKIEVDVIRYNEHELINNYINLKNSFIYDLIINYMNIMILIKLIEPNQQPIRGEGITNSAYIEYNSLIEIRRTLKLSHPGFHTFNITPVKDILRRFDYRQLLYFKNICNYELLTYKDIKRSNGNNGWWWKNLNTQHGKASCVIYDPVKMRVFYWINGWGDLPYTNICNMITNSE